jgi:transposase
MGSGKLSKKHVNNRGYNKYLKMNGEIKIEIDYEKFNDDQCWDGLKGYVTNTKLSRDEVMKNYNHLWQIEKAFRISKTDLRVRPIYHRLKDRIEAHICISFCAYSVFKELERILMVNRIQISPQRAIELTKTMYAIEYELPDSKLSKFANVNFSEIQKQLLDLFA